MSTRIVVVLGSARAASLGQHFCQLACEELRAAGAEVLVHDLLADGFDPVLRLEADELHAHAPQPARDALAARYANDVRDCDGIVVIHPVWWFQPPAILKGWIDRILVDGVALEQQASGPPKGLLGGKQMLVVQTFNASAQIDRVLFRGISAYFWKRVIGLPTGLRRVRRLALYGVEGLEAHRLEKFEKRLRKALGGLLG